MLIAELPFKEIVSMLTSFRPSTPSRARLFEGLLLVCLLALAPLVAQAQTGTPTRLYVKAGASGNGSGSSWTNACPTLSSALSKVPASGGAEIWVANGVYNEAVSLTTGTLLYGGFAGTETQLTQRAAGARTSILDASAANAGAPAPHVVSIQEVRNIRLDGFTLQGAQGNPAVTELSNGAGLFCANTDASVLITNCTITSNTATGDGGGVFFWDSDAILENCTVTGNQALYGGGVSCTHNSSVRIVRCTVVGNVANDSGGGVSCWESSPVIARCEISGNRSVKEGTPGIGGAGVYCTGASPRLENNLITGNISDGDAGGLLCLSASNATVANCVISSNVAKRNGGGLYCKDGSSPQVVNTVFSRNAKYSIFVFDAPSSPLLLHNLLRDNTPGDYYDLGLADSDQTSASAINQNVPGARGNVAGDPKFVMDQPEGLSGTWTTAPAFNADTRSTSLTDSAAHFVPGELAGRLLVTSATLPNQALILSNTSTTLELFGDATEWTTAGCRYQLVDYRLTSGSACVDAGTSQSAPLTDHDGVYRPVEIQGQGTDGSGWAYDIGVSETRKQYDLFVLPFGNVLDFGNRDWKAGPYDAAITLISNGYDPLNFETTTPLLLAGANVSDFKIANTVDTATTFTVGEERAVQIRFTPSARHSRKAQLTVTTNDTDKSPLTVQIQGYALPSAPNSLDLIAQDDTGFSSMDNITQLTSGLTIKGKMADSDVRVRLKEGDTLLAEDAASSLTTTGIDIALSEGRHSITACAVDEEGVETPPSAPLVLTVDPTPPYVTSITPSETGPTSATAVDFVVQFDSDVINFSTPSDVTVSVTGTAAYTALAITAQTASRYTVKVSGLSGTGEVALSVKANACESLAGLLNLPSAPSPAVWIDNSVPQLLPEPAWTSGTTNLIQWSPLERVTSYSLQVSLTADFTGDVTSLILDPSENNRLVNNLEDGKQYFYRLRAQKGPHFSTPWSNVVTSTQDATPPTGTVFLADSGFYSTNTIPVKLTANDPGTNPSGIVSCIFNDGSGWGAPEPFSASRTVTFSPGSGLRTLQVRFLDRAGNLSEIVQGSVTLDVDGPYPVAEVLDGGAWSTTSTLTFSWSATSDYGPAGVESYHLQVGNTSSTSNVFDGWVGDTLSKTLKGLPDGRYFARVQARDRAGNLGAFSQPSDGIGVDTVRPVAGTASASRYTNASPIPVLYQGASDSGSGLSEVRLWYRQGAQDWTVSDATSKTTSATLAFVPPVANTTYTLRLVATDVAGNHTPLPTGTDGTTVTYDTLRPQVTEVTPETTGPTSADSIAFTVRFSEPVTGFSQPGDVTVRHDPTGDTTHTGVVITERNASTYQVTVQNLAGMGAFTLAVNPSSCQDAAGNGNLASAESVPVQIDNTRPVFLAEPRWTTGTQNTVAWSPIPDAESYPLEICDLADFTTRVLSVEATSVTTSHTFDNLKDGVTYWYRIRVHKTTGFLSEWSDLTSSTQDATRPTGTLEDLAHGALYSSTTTLPVKLTASDLGPNPSGLASLSFNDGSGWSVPEPCTPDSLKTTRTVTLSPENGLRTLQFRFLDKAGNVSDILQSSITLDTQAPDPVAEVLDEGEWATTSSLTFSWPAASDNGPAGVDSYHLQVGNTSSTSEVFDGWVGDVLTKTLPTLPDGVYFARVQVRDRAGNLSAFSAPSDGIHTDTVPPVLESVSAPRYTNTQPIPVVYTGAADANNGLSEVRLWYRIPEAQDWTDTGLMSTANSATLAFVPPVANTTYTLRVVVTDRAGSTVERSVTVTYDTINPTVLEVTPETTGPTYADSIAFTVRFNEPVTGFSEPGDVTVRHDPTGDTTHTGVAIVEQNASTYRVTVQNITGQGAYTLAVNPSACQDLAGNANRGSSESLAVQIDNTRPVLLAEPAWTSGTQNTVAWKPVVDAETYPLEISTTADFTSPVLAVELTSATTSYTFDNLKDDTTYWYRVGVHKTTGFLSEWSDLTSSTQDNASPTGTIQINGGAHYTGSTTVTLQIAWLDPGTKPSGVTRMRLNDGAGWSDWEPAATSRTWSLSAGEGERTFLAEFCDRVGNVTTTATQAVIWLDTVNPEVPGTPVDTGLYSRSTHLTFTWTEPADSNGSGVAYYRYEILSGPNSTSATLVTAGTVPQPSVIFNGTNGGLYYCRVQAVDHAENASAFSEPSDGILVDTLAPTLPGTPVDEGEFSSSTLLTFRWTPSTDPGLSGVASYHYEVSTSPLFQSSALVTSGTTVLTSASCTVRQDTTYYCRVRALDRAGNQTPYTSGSDGILVDTQYPAVLGVIPSNVGPTYATSIAFEVTFDSPVWGFDSPEDVAIVHTGSQHTTVTLTALSETTYTVTVSGLTGPGSFTLAVVEGAAVDRAGNPVLASAPSQPVVLAAAPAAPEWVQASDGLYADRIEVTWTPGIAESYFRVFRSESPTDSNPMAVSDWQQETVFNDTTVESARTYYYWIRTAIDTNGTWASGLGASDSGWAIGSVLTDYQILYKNCAVTVTDDKRVEVTQLGERSSIKIRKLKNGAGGLVNRAGMSILTASAIPRMDVAGSLNQFYCEAPVKDLVIAGNLKTLTAKNGLIERLSVQGFGTVKVTCAPNSTHLTAPLVGRLAIEASGANPWPARINLTGVTLESLQAPQHTIKSITIASKKTGKNAYGLPYVSFGGVGNGSFVVAELLSLSVNGGGIEAPSVELTASQKPVKIATRSGAYSMGENGILPIFRPAHVLGSFYVTAPQFSLTTQGGDIRSELIVVSGEIKQLKANYVRAWTNRGLLAQGGHLGAQLDATASTSSSLFVAGTGSGVSRNIVSAFGALGVQGIFVAGADLTPEAAYPIAPNCQGTITSIGCNRANPSVYTLPRIVGESWASASKPIRFLGDKGATGTPAGFQVFTEKDLPFPKP